MILKKTTLSLVTSIAIISMMGLSGCKDDKGHGIKTGTPTPTPTQKVSTIIAVDGFIIGTFKKPLEVTVNGKTYKSETTIGKHGLITFKGVNIREGKGIIVVPRGVAKVDSNNDGKLNNSDKKLPIEMSAPSTAYVISPLTTLLVKMKAEKATIPAGFESAVLNFNPVTQVKGNDQAKKLIVLNEVLKTAMADDSVTPAELVKVDVAGLMKARTLKDVNVDTLVAKLPASVKAKAAAKAKVIKSLLPIHTGLKPQVDFETLIVAISDGEQTVKEAFHTAAPTLVPSDNLSHSDILSRVMVSGLKTTSQDYIENVIKTTTDATESIKGENYDVQEVAPEPIEKEPTSSSSSSSSTSSSSSSTSSSSSSTSSSGGSTSSSGWSGSSSSSTSSSGGIATPTLTLTNATITLGSNLNITVDSSGNFDDINITKTNDASPFYNISLTGQTGNGIDFTDKEASGTIELINDTSGTKVTMYITKAYVTRNGTQITTKFKKNVTHLKVVEVKNGSTKSFEKDIQTDMTNTDLSFNVQTIIDSLNDSQITNSFNDLKGRLNTAGAYTLKADISISDVTVTPTHIEGKINITD